MANQRTQQQKTSAEHKSTSLKATRFKADLDLPISGGKLSQGPLPAISRRPLVTLLPKVSARQRRDLPDRPKSCGLIQCRNRPCNVASHHSHVTTQLRSRGAARRKGNTQVTETPTLENDCDVMAVRGIVSPEFPFEGSRPEPIFRSLFHDFFTKVVDKMLMLVVRPSTNATFHRASLKEIRETMHKNTISSRAEYINLIGAAYGHLAGRMPMIPDESPGLIIQGELMKILRLKLKKYIPGADAQDVLRIMSTLVIVNLVVPSDRTVAMHAHRKAMSRVVDSYGGLHNIGSIMPVVVTMDRMIALYLGLPSLYTDWTSLSIPIQRAPLHPQVYGSFFDTDPRCHKIDNDAVVICREACRAIEILEGEKFVFDSSAIGDLTPEIHYLYFLRERVAAKFTHLNARLSPSSTWSTDWCIISACRIVDYIVLHDDYITAVTFLLADRLCNVIMQQDISTVWSSLQDGFDWIVFVLACVPNKWSGHTWAFDILQQRLRSRYGEKWPVSWQEMQLENLMHFVWSTVHLHDTFLALCRRLLVAQHNSSDLDPDPGYVSETPSD